MLEANCMQGYNMVLESVTRLNKYLQMIINFNFDCFVQYNTCKYEDKISDYYKHYCIGNTFLKAHFHNISASLCINTN